MKSMNYMCFMRLICWVVLCRPSKSNRQLRSRTDAQRRRGRSGGHWSEPFRSRTTFQKSESFFLRKKWILSPPPGDAFSRQVRVDGREFATEASVLDDPPCSQCHWSCFFKSKLVGDTRAALQDLQQQKIVL